MLVPSFRGMTVDRDAFAPLCTCFPTQHLSTGDLTGGADALAALAGYARAADGVLPLSAAQSTPDPFASLWFIRAAQLFAAADRSAGGAHALLITEQLIPLTKTILQRFISTTVGGARMDDGGLLVLPPDLAPATLRLNALWYSAIDATAAQLKEQGDRVGDHFERLAGRFRRSFAKAFWCDAHGRICPPEARALPDHGRLPDPEQLLLAFLPGSPIARTKQRQLLQLLRKESLGEVGLRIEHPQHGVVESLLHRAWLLRGLVQTSDTAPPAAEVAAISAPLIALRPQAHAAGLPAFYQAGQPLPHAPADPLTTIEVLGALQGIQA